MLSLSVDGATLAYDVTDLTPPWLPDPDTIILHHSVGATSGIWIGWLPVLATRFKVVRFDFRSAGASSAAGNSFDWTLESFASDVLAIADKVGARRFHLAGDSFGGILTLYIAGKHSSRLISATAISAAHRDAGHSATADKWKELLSSENGVKAWSQSLMQSRFYEGTVPKNAFEWFKSVQEQTRIEIPRRISQALIGFDLSADLRDLEMPVLLMAPDASPYVSTQLVSELHALIPDSELHIFSHARHGLAFTHAKECASILSDFAIRATAKLT